MRDYTATYRDRHGVKRSLFIFDARNIRSAQRKARAELKWKGATRIKIKREW